MDDIVLQGISFGEEGIQVGFLYRSEQSDEGGMERTVTILYKPDSEQALIIEDIKNVIAEFIDEYETKRRSPPESLPAGERLKRRVQHDGS